MILHYNNNRIYKESLDIDKDNKIFYHFCSKLSGIYFDHYITDFRLEYNEIYGYVTYLIKEDERCSSYIEYLIFN